MEVPECVINMVDYDMVQAEIVFLSKSENYNPELTPRKDLFNYCVMLKQDEPKI